MTIGIEYETEIMLDIAYEDIVRRVVLAAIEYEHCPYEAEVNVLFTDNLSIAEINREMMSYFDYAFMSIKKDGLVNMGGFFCCREYREIDAPTDVLSFPASDYETPADFDSLEERADCFHPETGELLLGDIVLSVEKILSQAEEYGHTRERELGFLVAHSMLHLFGYDHMADGEREEMERRQEAILEGIGLTR